MSNIAERFAHTGNIYFKSVVARTPAPPKVAPVPVPEESEPAKPNKRKSSTKAIQTRKGKYGGSKLKRKTVADKTKEGQNISKEDR